MFTEEELLQIIKLAIEADENSGDQSAGSGHMSHKSYSVDTLETSCSDGCKIEIEYSYTVFVETEFTMFPDNPPAEYHKKGKIVLDKDKNMITRVKPVSRDPGVPM